MWSLMEENSLGWVPYAGEWPPIQEGLRFYESPDTYTAIYTVPPGVAWQCPKCGRVWAPHQLGCMVCNERIKLEEEHEPHLRDQLDAVSPGQPG